MKISFVFPLLFVGLLSAGLSSCDREAVIGRGAVRTETRTLSSLREVEVSGDIPLTITNGATTSIQLEGYENLLPYVETTVEGSRLKLRYRSNTSISNSNLRAILQTPALEQVLVSGSATVRVEPRTGTLPYFRADVSGSGEIILPAMDIDRTQWFISGSGDIRGQLTRMREAQVTISGSGKAYLTVQQKLDASISGSGELHYWGTPTQVTSSVSGSGRLIRH